MNPILVSFGPLSVRAFTAALLVGAATGVILLAVAARQARARLAPWLDAGLALLIGAVIGARAVHVLLEMPYFSTNPGEVFNVSSGGLAWQGAAIGGLLGAGVGSRLRGVPFGRFLDALAPAVPLMGLCVWVGCGAAACAYGAEVRTLADYPAGVAIEAPDVYGNIVPRLNVPAIGAVWSIAVLVGVVLLILMFRERRRVARAHRLDRHSGGHLFAALLTYSLGVFVIDFLRGDYVPTWLRWRADQVLDLLVFGVAATALIRLKLVEWRHRPTPSTHAPSAAG